MMDAPTAVPSARPNSRAAFLSNPCPHGSPGDFTIEPTIMTQIRVTKI